MSGIPPLFLTLDLVTQAHDEMIRLYGGSTGIRDVGLIQSAIAQGQNVYHYAKADLFEIAAAYAYHLAENQAFLDGNKRTGAAAALSFLYFNGVDVAQISSREVYEMMIKIATKELSKSGLADLLRSRIA